MAFFIHPMWDSETQRLGKKKCTPIGSRLHEIADLMGFIGLALLVVIVLAFFAVSLFFEDFRLPSALRWIIFGTPIALGVLSELIMQISWWLAFRKGYKYDEEQCEVSWIENGERQIYKYDPNSG